ncbi:hypothetical protein [Natronomonas salina]|uniref:hypothetical protein n=1 Tax=Natronomonas salina TaxID=1710540 RepID=UPI001BA80B1E|nr:hypothetical protein [Natronomonas salina]
MDSLTEHGIDVADPRMNDAYIRVCSGGNGAADVFLVGVVHDHPASEYRAQRIVEAVAPETLALELPPLALPLFEEYATEATTPPSYGGEMSAAIQVDAADRTVGIDGPTLGFTGRLARTLLQERAGLPTICSSARALASVTKHAAVCRAAAALSRTLSVQIEVDASEAAYGTEWGDAPESQAENERRQVRKAQFILQAFGSSRVGNLRDATREEHMAARLSRLRRDGDVVAVVGIDHLDPLVELLDQDD